VNLFVSKSLTVLVFTICFVLLNNPVYATDVGGIIDTDTIWSSSENPYIVAAGILVESWTDCCG